MGDNLKQDAESVAYDIWYHDALATVGNAFLNIWPDDLGPYLMDVLTKAAIGALDEAGYFDWRNRPAHNDGQADG